MSSDIDYKQLFDQQLDQNKQLQLLVQQLRQQNAQSQWLIQQLQQQNAQSQWLLQQLQQQIERLLRAQFNKKSERKKRTSRQRARSISALSPKTEKSEVASRILPASFERVEIIHDVEDDKKQCPQCAIPLQTIKPLTTEQWAYRPGTLIVKKHVRCRYACRTRSQTIITAPMPNQPIEKGLADSSLLAQVIIDKYQDHLPLYRQKCRWLRQGIALSRQTLCDWTHRSAQWLSYLVDEMKKDILTSRKIHSDDTPFPVQAPGKTHQDGIEQKAKSMTPLARYYYRRRYAKPLLNQFHGWLRKTKHVALPKSLLGKAIDYALNHWRALCNYCRDGILDIDNNAAERAIRPLVLGRKNYLFAGSHERAQSAAIIYSIIETCKMWGVNTYDYLSDVLARLPNTLNKNIRQLLPYHWKPPPFN